MQYDQQAFARLKLIVGTILFIVLGLSIIFQIYGIVFISSILLSILLYKVLKQTVQIFILRIVIFARCSFSSAGWINSQQLSKLKDTKFYQGFYVPTQRDTANVLILTEKYKLAREYIKGNKEYRFIEDNLNYLAQKNQIKIEISQIAKIFRVFYQKFAKNYSFNYLQRNFEETKISQYKIQKVKQYALRGTIKEPNQKQSIISTNDTLKQGQFLSLTKTSFCQICEFEKNIIQGMSETLIKGSDQQAKQSRQREKRIQSNRGLQNLGNTCYMNSAIQCLHKTFELTEAIKGKEKSSNFIKAYLQMMDQLSNTEKTSPYSPKLIKKLVSSYYPIFQGYSQQDSSQLLSTLLNYISDQLNQVTTKNYHVVNNKIKRSNQQLFEQYLKKDYSRSKSILDDLVYGRYLTTYTCLNCNNQQKLFQKFNIIYLPVPNQPNLDLKICMKEFCKPDELRGKDGWGCANCNQGNDTDTDKTMSVYQANKILIIALKRFTENTKINSLIKFQSQITLKELTRNPKIENWTYDLYGVINHSGNSLHYGHYYSYCKVGDRWKVYNDRSVSQVNQSQIVSHNAFVLLYRLRE